MGGTLTDLLDLLNLEILKSSRFNTSSLIILRISLALASFHGHNPGVKNRLAELRAFMRADPELKAASTQSGFADLIGCSVALVRAVEQRHTRISQRLATSIQRSLGIDPGWLLDSESDDPPRTTSGEPLTMNHLRDRLDALGFHLPSRQSLPSLTLQGMVATALDQSLAALMEDVGKGDVKFLNDLFALLGERERRKKRPLGG